MGKPIDMIVGEIRKLADSLEQAGKPLPLPPGVRMTPGEAMALLRLEVTGAIKLEWSLWDHDGKRKEVAEWEVYTAKALSSSSEKTWTSANLADAVNACLAAHRAEQAVPLVEDNGPEIVVDEYGHAPVVS